MRSIKTLSADELKLDEEDDDGVVVVLYMTRKLSIIYIPYIYLYMYICIKGLFIMTMVTLVVGQLEPGVFPLKLVHPDTKFTATANLITLF